MSATPEDHTPDLEKLRQELEKEKQRVREAGDEQSIRRLEELERKADDPSFWNTAPSALDQLTNDLKRLGLK